MTTSSTIRQTPAAEIKPCWQDALTAWSDYVATGLHVTAEEADAWLARLQAGEDVEPPSPHE